MFSLTEIFLDHHSTTGAYTSVSSEQIPGTTGSNLSRKSMMAPVIRLGRTALISDGAFHLSVGSTKPLVMSRSEELSWFLKSRVRDERPALPLFICTSCYADSLYNVYSGGFDQQIETGSTRFCAFVWQTVYQYAIWILNRYRVAVSANTMSLHPHFMIPERNLRSCPNTVRGEKILEIVSILTPTYGWLSELFSFSLAAVCSIHLAPTFPGASTRLSHRNSSSRPFCRVRTSLYDFVTLTFLTSVLGRIVTFLCWRYLVIFSMTCLVFSVPRWCTLFSLLYFRPQALRCFSRRSSPSTVFPLLRSVSLPKICLI